MREIRITEEDKHIAVDAGNYEGTEAFVLLLGLAVQFGKISGIPKDMILEKAALLYDENPKTDVTEVDHDKN